MVTPLELPHVDEKCGEHFTYRDFFECSDSWKKYPVSNITKQLETYRAIERLCSDILDHVWSTFGEVNLTHGFSSPTLVAEIKKNKFPNITPTGDQHAGCELNSRGKLICSRRGIAVDFYVSGQSSLEIARWVAK